MVMCSFFISSLGKQILGKKQVKESTLIPSKMKSINFFDNKNFTLPIAVDEPSLRYIEAKANIHKINLQKSLLNGIKWR